MSSKGSGGGTKLKNRDEEKLQKPKKYKVVLHNDDFTPMDFVASLLMNIFRLPETAAWNITKSIHEKGRGIAGVYSKQGVVLDLLGGPMNVCANQRWPSRL